VQEAWDVRISDYSFGRIVVDGIEHDRDVIVLPDRVVGNWWRRNGHSLVMEDLDDVLEDLPEALIIGTGAYGRLSPDPAALDSLRERGIVVEAHTTAEAVKLFNSSDPTRMAAALHLTC
jgi:hypothetical protein